MEVSARKWGHALHLSVEQGNVPGVELAWLRRLYLFLLRREHAHTHSPNVGLFTGFHRTAPKWVLLSTKKRPCAHTQPTSFHGSDQVEGGVPEDSIAQTPKCLLLSTERTCIHSPLHFSGRTKGRKEYAPDFIAQHRRSGSLFLLRKEHEHTALSFHGSDQG